MYVLSRHNALIRRFQEPLYRLLIVLLDPSALGIRLTEIELRFCESLFR